ncbi:hypothetical protein HYFRA_00011624 [Hymenoscyphus fraxineus]|uniref:Amidase domain-containing protein n=1 Tax=Hymenoscyphus fraxineus TaxID=746836 RepID=A0A9N9L1A6_9HELO|nr:hypothetical protein HYFRA_00011624 [Hymenoscyphus fraxineus]
MALAFSILVLCIALIWRFPLSAALRFPNPSSELSTITRYPNLLNAGAVELIAGLNNRSWTSVDLTKAYILRINDVNPSLKAITELNPDALSIAASLDAERRDGTIRSPLHGIPILIKNNIATNDLMNNTAGSYSLLGARVPRDAPVAAKLRAAGVIILGKSNLSQWANFRSFNSSNGWSSYGGQVTGAYYPNMDPSGSSSGSGVASSIGLAFASLGTETSGSIISPSSVNNIVGIKPTVGLTSRSLVIPISEHQDTVGPMARTVSDAAFLLSIIAGKDVSDNYTLAQPFDTPPDYTLALNSSSLRGARIGIVRNVLPKPSKSNQPILDAFEEAILVMKKAGAVLADTAFSSYSDYTNNNGVLSLKVLNGDFVSDLPKYLSELTSNPNNITNLEDAASYTRNNPLEEYPQRDIGIWDEALAGFNNTSPQFWEAYQTTSFWGNEGGVTGALKAGDFDALILPSDFASDFPAFSGLPLITVPLGFYPSNITVEKSQPWGLVEVAPNIPFGISFLGPKWSEELLIGLAYSYEQRTQTRNKIQPYLIPKPQLCDVVSKRR